MNCAVRFFRLVLPGATRRSLELRRDGQVDKGRQVVFARHWPVGGLAAPLEGVGKVDKGEQVVSAKA